MVQDINDNEYVVKRGPRRDGMRSHGKVIYTVIEEGKTNEPEKYTDGTDDGESKTDSSSS